MPKWSFSRRQQPSAKPAPQAEPAKTPPARTGPPANPAPPGPARRAADVASDGRSLQVQFEEAHAVQNRLRQDLAELLKAHRQQGRGLERNQKLLEQTEQELSRHRGRAATLETELAEQPGAPDRTAARVEQLEQIVAKHATLETAYETLDRERQDLNSRLSELTRSRANAAAE